MTLLRRLSPPRRPGAPSPRFVRPSGEWHRASPVQGGGLRYNATDSAAGAQTERRSDAWPVRTLLSREDAPAVFFFSTASSSNRPADRTRSPRRRTGPLASACRRQPVVEMEDRLLAI